MEFYLYHMDIHPSINDCRGDNDNIEIDYVNRFYDENGKKDQLIVMNDVSGLADRSNKFASFLTTTRKFRYHCFYIFHVIFLKKTHLEIDFQHLFSTFFLHLFRYILLRK